MNEPRNGAWQRYACERARHTSPWQDTPKRNDDEDLCEGGPCALLRDRELMREAQGDRLKAEIQKGIESADRGELIPAENVFDRLETKYRAVAERRP
jgi:hypothetical protein